MSHQINPKTDHVARYVRQKRNMPLMHPVISTTV